MRKLFSYVLLVSILSPTGVEVFHAIHDSHEIITEQNTSINENKFDCQINLLSFQDDDFNFSSNILHELVIYQIPFINIIEADDLKLDNISSTFLKRGPPTLT